MKKVILLPFVLCLFVLGCGMPSSGTHTIEKDSDWFETDYNGRKVGCRNWVVTVDGKQIPIEKKKSVSRLKSVLPMKSTSGSTEKKSMTNDPANLYPKPS